MILKIVLLVWFVAFAISLFAKAEGRTWMVRLFVFGFCLLALGFFLKIFSRII
jgi:heme O synthase-like polyprenyltransferase